MNKYYWYWSLGNGTTAVPCVMHRFTAGAEG